MRDTDFERLYEEHAEKLLAFLVYRTGDRPLAEDLLADTFERVLKTRRGFDRRKASEKTWLYAIARHIRVDHYRKAYRTALREQQVEVLPEAPAATGGRTDRGPDLEALLGALPESQREVITMLKVSGMSLEEVARATSSSVGSVKQKAHRAYEKLRGLLQDRGLLRDDTP